MDGNKKAKQEKKRSERELRSRFSAREERGRSVKCVEEIWVNIKNNVYQTDISEDASMQELTNVNKKCGIDSLLSTL